MPTSSNHLVLHPYNTGTELCRIFADQAAFHKADIRHYYSRQPSVVATQIWSV